MQMFKTRDALVEAIEGLDWREIDSVAEVSAAKRDLATLHACLVELESRANTRQPDPIGFALAMRHVRQLVQAAGLRTH